MNTRLYSHNPLRCVKTLAVIALSVAGLQLSCDRLLYPFRPFVHSTAPFLGVVRDSLSNAPIAAATIRIGDEGYDDVTTDRDGTFRFDKVPTGETVLSVTAAGYRKLTLSADITLETPELACSLVRLDAPPEVVAITIDSSGLRFFDDPVSITFRASDSSGGIVAVRLFIGDTGIDARQKLFGVPVYSLADSFVMRYPSPAIWNACLEIIGAHGDTSRDSFTVNTRRPQRPQFSLLRTQGRFLSGEPGYLQVAIDDPDSVCTRLSVDWGDGSAAESFYRHQGTWWHTYTYGSDTLYTISVTLFGAALEAGDTVIPVTVSKINPPVLDGRLYFEPSQYCAPHDTAILIGVRVRDIEGWVQQIVWIINEHDPLPAFTYNLDVLGEVQGAVPDGSALFVHRFPTTGFKGVNDVRIMVVDRYGTTSTVTGNFYIAGKPGG